MQLEMKRAASLGRLRMALGVGGMMTIKPDDISADGISAENLEPNLYRAQFK
jgi:hypothetical protein